MPSVKISYQIKDGYSHKTSEHNNGKNKKYYSLLVKKYANQIVAHKQNQRYNS
jgi:hypothetical protein